MINAHPLVGIRGKLDTTLGNSRGTTMDAPKHHFSLNGRTLGRGGGGIGFVARQMWHIASNNTEVARRWHTPQWHFLQVRIMLVGGG